MEKFEIPPDTTTGLLSEEGRRAILENRAFVLCKPDCHELAFIQVDKDQQIVKIDEWYGACYKAKDLRGLLREEREYNADCVIVLPRVASFCRDFNLDLPKEKPLPPFFLPDY